jgi:hypothetical protein
MNIELFFALPCTVSRVIMEPLGWIRSRENNLCYGVNMSPNLRKFIIDDTSIFCQRVFYVNAASLKLMMPSDSQLDPSRQSGSLSYP